MTYFVRKSWRRILKFIIVLKQGYWFELNSNNEYFISIPKLFHKIVTPAFQI